MNNESSFPPNQDPNYNPQSGRRRKKTKLLLILLFICVLIIGIDFAKSISTHVFNSSSTTKHSDSHVQSALTASPSPATTSTHTVKEISIGGMENQPITSFVIPDGVTKIEDRAFYNCSSLTSITIPDSVTSIGEHAFAYCSSLTSITIPDSVTSIEQSAFLGMRNLETLHIPDNVTTIGKLALCTWTSTKFSVSPENPIFEMIDDVVFNKVEKELVRYSGKPYSFAVYTVPSNTRIIGPAAFDKCDNLLSITLPDGVERIEERAFSGCALEYINLPSSIEYIAKDAIEANSKLVIEVKSDSYAEQYCKDNNLNYRCSDSRSSFESGIISGVYYLVPQCAPNSRLTAVGSNSAANVQIYESNGSTAQKFRFEKLENGCYEIICELSGMALGATDDVAVVGANVQLLYRNGTDAQQWNLVDVGDGFYYIVSKFDANLVLDVWGGGDQNGTEVQIWGKNETPAQKWSLIR